MVGFEPTSPPMDAAAVDIDPKSEWLREALLARSDCDILRQLYALRDIGWASPLVEAHFREQRYQADYVKAENTDEGWALTMHDSLKYMDCDNRRFVRTDRFLDIGCNPGGYSTYILRTCLTATGMGISLPVEDGGHGCAIGADVRHRIDIRYADITLLNLAPGVRKPEPPVPSGSRALALVLAPMPFKLNSFDFVSCDAHNLRLHPDNDLRPWNWTRLLISQILLALHAVEHGGTIFLKLSGVERPLTARILMAFYRIAGNTHTVKSKLIHRKRGSFYLLARGIRVHTFQYRRLVAGLQKLWMLMTFGGPNGYGRDITWGEQDLITPWDEVMSPNGVNQIARLGVHMWRIQYNALHKFLLELGVIDAH